MKIVFEKVSFYYDNKLPTTKPVLKEVSLEIGENEFIGIVGPSGSGKTTLLQHFTGLLEPTSGRVLFDGDDIFSKNYNLNSLRGKIGVVFQFPESQLFEESVYDDIAFGPRNYQVPEDEIEQRAGEVCEMLGLDFSSVRNRSPFTLSEGEKRRVALAGIVVMEPDFLILDEPTACLDASGVKQVQKLLSQLSRDGKTIVLVSHDLEFVARMCERIVVLKNGIICYDGLKPGFFKNKDMLHNLSFDEPRLLYYYNKIKDLRMPNGRSVLTIDEIRSRIGV